MAKQGDKCARSLSSRSTKHPSPFIETTVLVYLSRHTYLAFFFFFLLHLIMENRPVGSRSRFQQRHVYHRDPSNHKRKKKKKNPPWETNWAQSKDKDKGYDTYQYKPVEEDGDGDEEPQKRTTNGIRGVRESNQLAEIGLGKGTQIVRSIFFRLTEKK